MIFSIFQFLTLTLAVLIGSRLVGFPAASLLRSPGTKPIEKMALSAATGLCIWIVVGGAAYRLLAISGLGLLFVCAAVVLILNVALKMYLLRGHAKTQSHSNFDIPSPMTLTFGALAATAIFVAALPALSPQREITFTTGIGPDAIGYAVASQALAAGVTLEGLEDFLGQSFPGWPADAVLSPLTYGVYGLASMTTQVQAEFIAGAGRIGLAIMAFPLLLLGGPQSVWTAHLAVSTAALFIAGGLLVGIARRIGQHGWVGTAFTVPLAGSGMTLYAFWQGGVAQVLAIPLVLLATYGFLRAPGWQSVGFSAVGIAALAYTYSDALPLMLAGYLLAVLIARRSRQRWSALALNLFASISLGIVLAFPIAAGAGKSLAKRLLDTAQGGWQIPGRPGFFELVGLAHIENIRETGGIPPSLLSTGAFLVVALALLLAARRFSGSRSMAAALGVSGALIIWGLSAWSVANQTSNYVHVKAAVSLMPFVIIGLMTILPLPSESKVGSRDPEGPLRSQAFYPVSAVLVTLCLLVLAGSVNWANDWRRNAFYLNPALLSDDNAAALEEALGRFAFVANEPWVSVLSASGDLGWVNRSPRMAQAGESARELAYLRAALDVGGQRPDSVPLRLPADRIEVAPGVTIVPLGVNASSLEGLDASSICEVARAAYFVRYGTIHADPCIAGSQIMNVDAYLGGPAPTKLVSRNLTNQTSRCSSLVIVWRGPGPRDLLSLDGQRGDSKIQIQTDGQIRFHTEWAPRRHVILGTENRDGWNILRYQVSAESRWTLNGNSFGAEVSPIDCRVINLSPSPSIGFPVVAFSS